MQQIGLGKWRRAAWQGIASGMADRKKVETFVLLVLAPHEVHERTVGVDESLPGNALHFVTACHIEQQEDLLAGVDQRLAAFVPPRSARAPRDLTLNARSRCADEYRFADCVRKTEVMSKVVMASERLGLSLLCYGWHRLHQGGLLNVCHHAVARCPRCAVVTRTRRSSLARALQTTRSDLLAPTLSHSSLGILRTSLLLSHSPKKQERARTALVASGDQKLTQTFRCTAQQVALCKS